MCNLFAACLLGGFFCKSRSIERCRTREIHVEPLFDFGFVVVDTDGRNTTEVYSTWWTRWPRAAESTEFAAATADDDEEEEEEEATTGNRMQMSQQQAFTDVGARSRLPVFVFPASLVFYADDQSSQKQVMTLYNPYDFALRFKVLSTAPRKYVVLDAEGTIKPRCCIDIVVRHNAILPCNYGVVDKFRVQMSEPSSVVGRRSGTSSSSIIGGKDVPATLKATSKLDVRGGLTSPHGSGGGGGGGGGSMDPPTEHFEQLVAPAAIAHSRAQQYSIGLGLRRQNNEEGGIGGGGGGGGGRGPSMIVILAGLVCIFALLLPTEGQQEPSNLPSYLHLSVPQKLIFAYALGLVTMVILKT